VGHYLGMDTHDTHLVSRSLGLHPGMVITVEPGIYISEDNKKVPERQVMQSSLVLFRSVCLFSTNKLAPLSQPIRRIPSCEFDLVYSCTLVFYFPDQVSDWFIGLLTSVHVSGLSNYVC